MTEPATIVDLLTRGADEAPAIGAPDRHPLSYAGLRGQVDRTVRGLRAMGIGRDDTVALVLPNGPEMASAFISVAAGATTAPLNPAYKGDEFEFYLKDLECKLLLVQSGMDTPATAAAKQLGIQVVELSFDPSDPAGVFTLPVDSSEFSPDYADSGGLALVLHTSGTTSRPKIVPLTQGNVCASAANVAASLSLTADDRCLNIMPLFHIHGLIAVLLGSLSVGASVSCTPGFNALKFFSQLESVKPSWYSGVPTMHQAILARAERNAEAVESARLRLIRSSSASLPPQVMKKLEQVFSAPVIEAYGMTEAAHQMTSNPLPPGERRPGSVGLAAGPEIAIMDPGGAILGPGEIGEVVIRGPNVTPGYRNNDKANAASFVDGWFRTGDQGVLDGAGYLQLTGRLKEIINRGGEKISPREVDEVLLDHPAVAQAVTFAVPHDKLGEDVAAAIVLHEESAADQQDIRRYAAERLADSKVPRQVLIMDEIPKGATGKFQRIGMAEKLKLT